METDPKQEINQVKDNFTGSPLNDILLDHRNQNIRQEQLRKINESRSMYDNNTYAVEFEKLDSRIAEIEEDIFTCKKIPHFMKKYGVGGIVFAHWCRGSIHIERIRLAYLLSAEYQMDLSTTVLEDGIMDKDLDGNFKKTEIEYAGLIRELSLAHSRQAGFKNQAKFGKKPVDPIMDKPIQQVTDEQLQMVILEFRKMKLEESYIAFENIKPQFVTQADVNAKILAASGGEKVERAVEKIINSDEPKTLEQEMDEALEQRRKENERLRSKENEDFDKI